MLAAFFCIGCKTGQMQKQKWIMDHAHSEIRFRVRHMAVSHVTGFFHKFNAEVETDGDDLTTAKVHFTADINSISTNNQQRDAHLKSDDFFDAENHPEVIFDSTSLEKKDDEHYTLKGMLTIRDVTQPVELDVEYGGMIQDPYGLTRAGFHVEGKINRKEFNMRFDAMTEAGGLVVGNEVKLHCDVEFTKQQSAQNEQKNAA
jgi:polyisoprenoid-binding protein YceI